MDFREFSEAYNNYLMHARSGKKPDWWDQGTKRIHKEGNFLAQYVTDPFWKKEVISGYVDSEIYDACMRIAQNNNYTDSQKKAMIENKLRPWFSQMGHNDFREFSEAYNNYLMHAGTNNGVNIGRLMELFKKYKKKTPSEKHPKIDQLSRIVIQQAQNGNLEQAREVAQEINRITPGSPSSMLFQAIMNELTKPQQTYRMADGVPRPR